MMSAYGILRGLVRIAAVGVLANAAVAQTCTPREFAQYMLDAKDPIDRIQVTYGYCSAKLTRDLYQLSSPQAVRCDAEMKKAADALKAVKDNKAYSFALAGCPKGGAYP